MSFSLFSCFRFKEPEFKGIESIKINKISVKAINLELVLRINNPNKYKIKIDNLSAKIDLNKTPLGNAKTISQNILEKNKLSLVKLQIQTDLKSVSGNIFSLLKTLKSQNPVKVNIKGSLKASVKGISKKIEFSEEKILALSQN